LVPSELGKVEAFVDYVMEGVEYEQPSEGSDAEPTPRVPIRDVVPEIEQANEREFVKQLVTVEADGLKDPDRDRVLEALKAGKITRENLQASLDKIQEIKEGYSDD
jgi:hypothetical protein